MPTRPPSRAGVVSAFVFLFTVMLVPAARATKTGAATVWDSASLNTLLNNRTSAGWADLYSGRPAPVAGRAGANLVDLMGRLSDSASLIATYQANHVQIGYEAGGYALLSVLTATSLPPAASRNAPFALDLLRSLCGINNASGISFDCRNDPWDPTASGASDCDSNQAAAVRSLSLALDALWTQLPAADASTCVDILHQHAESLYQASIGNGATFCVGTSPGWWRSDWTNNHSWNNFAAIGVAGQALEGTAWDADASKYRNAAAQAMPNVKA